MKNQEPKQATKREQIKRINGLIKELQSESTKRMLQDLETLSKPYYYKGRTIAQFCQIWQAFAVRNL